MRSTLYQPDWQVLRLSCLTPYNSYGGMTMRAGAEDSIRKLKRYIDESSAQPYMNITQEEEKALRTYRVHNLLTAASNGFNAINAIDKELVAYVDAQRDIIEKQLENNLVVQVADRWNWEIIKEQYTKLFINKRHWFNAILEDFEGRRNFKGKDSEDLLICLKFMYDIRDRRNT